MSVSTEDLTIRKTLSVPIGVEEAWQLFTERASSWWPFPTHSIGGEATKAAVMEGRPGGRFYERQQDGTEADWAIVRTWEPPTRLVLEWKVDPSCASEVEVRFAPEGDGTRVVLEHRGWEAYGDGARDAMASYDGGWDVVLRPYVEAARPAS